MDIAIAEAEQFVGNIPAETAVKIKGEFKAVQLDNRRCIFDLLIFNIEEV